MRVCMCVFVCTSGWWRSLCACVRLCVFAFVRACVCTCVGARVCVCVCVCIRVGGLVRERESRTLMYGFVCNVTMCA